MTSRAFEDLERRCKSINKKRYLKIFVFLFVSIGIITIAFFDKKFW